MIKASAQVKKQIIKIICGIIICVLLIAAGFLITDLASQKRVAPKIITSNFVGYDYARAVAGDASEISMLLKPGTETHNFEPTPEDIINIKKSDLFIYVGGESEEWIKELLQDNEIPAEKTLRLMDLVEVKEEEISPGMEGNLTNEKEDDEHIWTSPINAIKLVNGIRDKMTEIYSDKATTFIANSKSYTDRISRIDSAIREIVKNSQKNELIFGDRFPFRYFVDEYELDYYAAFPGCAEQTEASSNTIAFLINKAKKDNINVILKIELTDEKLARTIAEEIGGKVLELNAAHNIPQKDFDAGVTYADIMEENIEVLKEALK